MSANGWWDNEERSVARYEVQQSWDWHDLCALIDQTMVIARKQRAPVQVIIELQAEPASPALQFDRVTLDSGRAFARRVDEAGCAIVIVGASLLVKTLYTRFEIAYTSGNARLYFVDDLPQARALLAHYYRGAVAATVTVTA